MYTTDKKESCKNCIHHGLCKYESKMTSFLDDADILAFEYMLVVNNLLVNSIDDRIRCVRWIAEEDK